MFLCNYFLLIYIVLRMRKSFSSNISNRIFMTILYGPLYLTEYLCRGNISGRKREKSAWAVRFRRTIKFEYIRRRIFSDSIDTSWNDKECLPWLLFIFTQIVSDIIVTERSRFWSLIDLRSSRPTRLIIISDRCAFSLITLILIIT